MGPILELWQQLTSSTPGMMVKRQASVRNPEGGGKTANTKGSVEPVDDFVNMEYELAGEVCAVVNSMLSSLKKV